MQTKTLTRNGLAATGRAGLLLLAVMAAGCGGTDSQASNKPKEAPLDPADEAKLGDAVEPVTSGSLQTDRRYYWELATNGDAADRGPNGFAASVTVQLGRPVEPADPLPEGFAELAPVCDVDQETDLFVPLRITVRNRADFAGGIRTGLRFMQRSTGTNDLNVSGAVKYTDGPQCRTNALQVRDPSDAGRAGIAMSNEWATVSPMETKRADWLLIITGYRGNEFPEGNQKAFEALRASIQARLIYEDSDYLFHDQCYTGKFSDIPNVGVLGYSPTFALAPDLDSTLEELEDTYGYFPSAIKFCDEAE